MKKLLLLLILLTFGACAPMVNLDKRARDINLGMTKKEAIRVLGDKYTVEAKVHTMDGGLEILKFRSEISDNYVLHFLDDVLVEFYKEVLPPPKEEHKHPNKGDR